MGVKLIHVSKRWQVIMVLNYIIELYHDHSLSSNYKIHDDVIKWKHFPRYWPFVWGIHRSPMNSLHKGQWRRALMLSLICTQITGWVNNGEAGDLRCHHPHYDVIVMFNNRLNNHLTEIYTFNSTLYQIYPKNLYGLKSRFSNNLG